MFRKLYGKMRKRLAKKFIGHPRWWQKLEYGLKLKPGDLVSSCRGYNEQIAEIKPRFHYTRRGWVITDFSIQMISGGSCSLMHCCTFPLETKEQVIAYFKSLGTPEAVARFKEGGWLFSSDPKVIGVMAGKEVFNEKGQPLYEYCNQDERVVRFPNETRADMQREIENLSPDRYGKSTTYEEAYIEGWASFALAWPNEENPYEERIRSHWGYAAGRQHAVQVGI